MGHPLESLMSDFGRAVGLPGITIPDNGIVTFRLDGEVDVNVMYSADSHRFHVFSMSGEALAASNAGTAFMNEGEPPAWVCNTRSREGFEWSVRHHLVADLRIHSVSADAESLDASRFGELVEQFVDVAKGHSDPQPSRIARHL